MVLEATGKDTIPQSDWDQVRLYTPHSQRVQIKHNRLFEDLARHTTNRVFPEDHPGLRHRAVVLFRPPMKRDNGVGKLLDGAGFTYSMWGGYLKDAYGRDIIGDPRLSA